MPSGRHSTLPPSQPRGVVPLPGAHARCQALPSHPHPAEGGVGWEQLPPTSCSPTSQPGTLSSLGGVRMGILMETMKTIIFSPHQYAKSSRHFPFLLQL